MQVEITVDWSVPEDEFNDLIKVYPLGKYLQGGESNWFRVEIDSSQGHICLTWFKKW